MSIARRARMLDAAARDPLPGGRVFGPPAGPDGYRERNIALTRNKIAQARIERNEARRVGNHRLADVIQMEINGWAHTLSVVAR